MSFSSSSTAGAYVPLDVLMSDSLTFFLSDALYISSGFAMLYCFAISLNQYPVLFVSACMAFLTAAKFSSLDMASL